ncbi:MAG: DUF3885 domain-containing protein [Cyanobacteriota bacterium]
MNEIELYLKNRFRITNLFKNNPIQKGGLYLRFDLGDKYENKGVERVNKATIKALEIFNSIFNNKEQEIWLLVNQFEENNILKNSNKYLHKQIKNYFFKEFREFEFEDIIINQIFIKIKLNNLNYENILNGIANREMGFMPIIGQIVYFIEPQKDIIFYMYDDRGCLVISNKVENISYLKDKYYNYINLYDLNKINDIFRIGSKIVDNR